ncbi:uncharacterized protein LOC126799082 [Argentina anserina]|uniref:uncharacterized protein LOC126799082 n=1 Tax=Argentina anserina TaxID=57926 RepID=UPI00217655B9|nr:uncharacterized protein LOC126799082 [Potentilla anserina]
MAGFLRHRDTNKDDRLTRERSAGSKPSNIFLLSPFSDITMTQFAMVEELASLVKDNLSCKHLILSVEEALVDFLQSDTSSSGLLQLEPMNSYNRLLLHRLADIFGFSHESVGEGEERHLVLGRCPETSIPSILVSDILWQCDEPESPMTSHLLLKRSETPPVLRKSSPSLQYSLEEREAAYVAARERIFSRDLGEVKESVTPRQRTDPVVARRMIAHALGKRINPTSQDATYQDCNVSREQSDKLNIQAKVEAETNFLVEAFQQTVTPLDQNVNSRGEVKKNNRSLNPSLLTLNERKTNQKQDEKSDAVSGISSNGRKGHGADEEDIKREHLGAAKRMFAHALGTRSGKNGVSSKGSEIKHVDRE